MQMTMTYKYLTTFALFFAYFAYGVNFYVVGPTLIELSALFQTTIERICIIYTVRSAGYTFGSLSGFLFNYINRQCAFIFFLTTMGITLILMPHCATIFQLFTLAAINGFSIGSFDTAINVWLLEMWGEDSGPYMQALHFTYGLGSFVAPLICEPFLSHQPTHLHHQQSSILDTNYTVLDNQNATLNSLNSLNSTELLTSSNGLTPIEYLIYIPYAFAGGITIAAAGVVMMLYAYKKYEPPPKPVTLYAIASTTDNKEKSPESKTVLIDQLNINARSLWSNMSRHMPPFFTIWLVTMGSLFLTFFVGMEQMHLQFLPTFAVNTDLSLSQSEAALVSSAAAAAFTVGRGLSIPLAVFFRPQHILYSNHLLMIIGTVILAIYANSSELMLWIGNIILGAGFSSVYASIYAFLEQQIRVTNIIGSVFVFAGGVTAALSPSIVGQYIEANPLILVWFNLVCVILSLAILIAIHLSVCLKARSLVSKIDYNVDSEVKILPLTA